jgi:hypothetical protein
MTRRGLFLAVLPALLLLAATAATAQIATTPPPASIYRLAPESAFEEGCFDPCLCPVHFTEGLIGTMRLAPGAPDPAYAVFEVREVNWFVPGLEYWVTGAGTYRIGGQPLMQRLDLDLLVGDRSVQHYDSGLVLAGGGLAEIAVTITMNNMVCHDTVFHLVAKPINLREIVPYALNWSSYAEGCFGPCDCLTIARPLTGRFGLLKLAKGEAGEDFAVLDFRGWVREPGAATDGWPVLGSGIYRVGTIARDQRMRLALLENGRGPTRFDSGAVPEDGNLKRIDIDVAENGFACYDRVYSLHARRRPPAVMTFQVITPDPVDPVVAPAP